MLNRYLDARNHETSDHESSRMDALALKCEEATLGVRQTDVRNCRPQLLARFAGPLVRQFKLVRAAEGTFLVRREGEREQAAEVNLLGLDPVAASAATLQT